MERESVAVDEEMPSAGRGGSARTGLIGTLLVLYWLLDGLVIGAPVVILAALFNPLIVFVVAAALLVPLNIWFCGWLDGHWTAGRSGYAKRVETRLEKVRSGRVMKHPAKWVTSGSDTWFAVAAALTNAITVVCLTRVVGGQPLGRHRVLLAGIGYGLGCSAIWAFVGFLLSDAVRAL